MAAPTAIRTHGTLSASDIVDETNLLVKSVSITPSRTKREYMGGGVVKAVQYRNPLLTFDFDSQISAEAGLGVQEPGTEVASLANHTGTLHGFDTTGTYVFEDPVRDLTNEDAPALKFKVVLHPHIA